MIIPVSHFFQISFCLYFTVIDHLTNVDHLLNLSNWNKLQDYIQAITDIDLGIKTQDNKVFMTLGKETLCVQDISQTDYKHLRSFAHCPCKACDSNFKVTPLSQIFKDEIKLAYQSYVKAQSVTLALQPHFIPLLESLQQDLNQHLPNCQCILSIPEVHNF